MDNPKASTRTSLGGLGIKAASITFCNNNNNIMVVITKISNDLLKNKHKTGQ
jgi:hypothetical protein